MYTFIKVFLQDKSIHVVFIFSNLKVMHDLYSQCLTEILSKTTCFISTKEVYTCTTQACNAIGFGNYRGSTHT
jgi:hypothetical protein